MFKKALNLSRGIDHPPQTRSAFQFPLYLHHGQRIQPAVLQQLFSEDIQKKSTLLEQKQKPQHIDVEKAEAIF